MNVSSNGARAITFAVVLLPVLGCGGSAGVGDDVSNRGEGVTGPGYGVDYAWARPAPSDLAAQGYGFVARYLSYDTTGKDLSAGEAADLTAAGLDLVVVWEWGAQDALQGYGLGVQHAQAADGEAQGVGQPAGRPIYFAVDFDAQPSDQGAIDAYFDGVASVIGHDRTGVYAGYGPVSRLFDDGKVAWGWQTYAWSYGQWDPRAQLRQIQNGIGPGGEMDEDQSMVDDFGQWGPAGGPSGPVQPPSCSVNGVPGTCIDVGACAAMPGYVSTPGYCPGPSSEECCTAVMGAPAAPPSCNVNGVDGTCIDVGACAQMPGYVSTPGYCPGPASEECCTAAPAQPPAPSCDVGGILGTCIDTGACSGMPGFASVPGFCPGPASEQCCIPVPSCWVNGTEGACLDTGLCAALGRTSTPGYCPGPASEECCT
jgi:hypothetical protein